MTNDAGARRLPSWIDGFVEYTEGIASPLIFRRWGAISALAGLLERRVYLTTAQGDVYPNLYILLIGPPGVGKSEAIRFITDLWREMKDLPGGHRLHVAPDNMTKASLVKALSKAATRTVLSDTQLIEYHSLLVASSEFSVFFPQYDPTFMSVLTDLYDCRHSYTEDRISTGEMVIPRPQLHFIGGTTPGFMSTAFPETAWTMGFSSRLIMVNSSEVVRPDLFAKSGRDPKLWEALVADAKKIVTLWGQLQWDEDAARVLTHWHTTSNTSSAPKHPKLATYNTRRILQVLKLCSTASISRSSDLRVSVDDVSTAIAWLLEVEQYMADIFGAIGGAGGNTHLMDLHHLASKLQAAGRTISKTQVVNYLAARVPAYQVRSLMEIALTNGMFEEEGHHWIATGGQ